jgi:predicted RNA-binding protein YlqC (UPF0109 family)
MSKEIEKKMADLLSHLVEELVDDPENVQVESNSTSQTVVFAVKVLKGDVGKIIGKGGRTAHSIRDIMFSVARKHRVRCVIDFVE